jgi:catechol 2,3-dioxygenase-like lactoylglutathione lyase family enzyme
MIDHVSIAVRNLDAATAFYQKLLATLGHVRLREDEGTVGFGKRYPEFWLNERKQMRVDPESGAHVCLRARDRETVDAFHAVALANGANSEGAPALRPHYHAAYYAAFIRDPDGNRVEVVTFLKDG